MPLVRKAKLKRLGRAGDDTPWQAGACFIGSRSAEKRRATVGAARIEKVERVMAQCG